MKRAIWLLAALALLLGGAGQAKAGFIITFSQDGNNVDATGTGSLNLSALSLFAVDSAPAQIVPNQALVLTGSSSTIFGYVSTTGPTSIGPGSITEQATAVSGPEVGIWGSSRTLFVPEGYVSGTSLTSGATWDNTTISGLGLTPGTYTWTWGSEVGPDYLKVVIPAPSAVPEPSTLALLGMATASFAGHFGWRRRKVVATTT
jgi:hypothetical protein